ncbi:L-rhamnose-binding lectin CSL2 isoform X2 [Danio aesculapii]|uniref:L-rhamnose-binding lectin CSL2 isoform X2 n=1 Tax=Danio aesculapii TaxID=1142201 RepID=UPI0024BFFABB|nr:L-rhamnose-binding lectin CSL2 isoform X2 [Danio aesculapii]
MIFVSVLLLLVQMNSRLLISADTVNTCDGTVLSLSCENGKIQVTAANYGRTDKFICSEGRPSWQLQDTNCYSPNALAMVSKSCNGLKSCEFVVAHTIFTDPCIGTYKYLSTTYFCSPSEIRSSTACESTNAVLNCEAGTVIHIQTANYGRTDSSICSAGRPASQLTKTDCYSPNSQTVVTNGY